MLPTTMMRRLFSRSDTSGLAGFRDAHQGTDRIDTEIRRVARRQDVFTVMVADLDDFTAIRSTYGRPTGDRLLQWFGNLLNENVRSTDQVFYLGRSDFMVVASETDRRNAYYLVMRLSHALARGAFKPSSTEALPVAATFGLAEYRSGTTAAELIDRARSNMHDARSQGKTVLYETTSTFPAATGMAGVLFEILSHKDRYTVGHCEMVADLLARLGRTMGVDQPMQEQLYLAGLLHDVGKIGIPDSILRKPARLSADEYDVMRRHVLIGTGILSEIPQYAKMLDAVAQHHERFDGKGYPAGIAGTDISVEGRMIACVDAFSAMTLDRPYHKAVSVDEALRELRAQAGKQFDGQVVEAFEHTVYASMHDDLDPGNDDGVVIDPPLVPLGAGH